MRKLCVIVFVCLMAFMAFGQVNYSPGIVPNVVATSLQGSLTLSDCRLTMRRMGLLDQQKSI